MTKSFEIDALIDAVESFEDKYLSNGYLNALVGAKKASDYSLSMSVEIDDEDETTIYIVTNIISDEKKIKIKPEKMEEIADMMAGKLEEIIRPILSENGFNVDEMGFLGLGKVDGEELKL